jgi:hypothetical protein
MSRRARTASAAVILRPNDTDIGSVQISDTLVQAQLTDRAQLVRHGLSLLTVHPHICLRRVETGDIGRQRYHRNAVELTVRNIVADDDRKSRLANFSADRRIEGNPPNLPALRRPIWALGDIAGQAFDPFRGLALARLIGSHRPVTLDDIALRDVRSREIVQESADPPPSDDAVQALIDLVVNRNRQLLDIRNSLHV